jgi:hypothetical protein
MAVSFGNDGTMGDVSLNPQMLYDGSFECLKAL